MTGGPARRYGDLLSYGALVQVLATGAHVLWRAKSDIDPPRDLRAGRWHIPFPDRRPEDVTAPLLKTTRRKRAAASDLMRQAVQLPAGYSRSALSADVSLRRRAQRLG